MIIVAPFVHRRPASEARPPGQSPIEVDRTLRRFADVERERPMNRDREVRRFVVRQFHEADRLGRAKPL